MFDNLGFVGLGILVLKNIAINTGFRPKTFLYKEYRKFCQILLCLSNREVPARLYSGFPDFGIFLERESGRIYFLIFLNHLQLKFSPVHTAAHKSACRKNICSG